VIGYAGGQPDSSYSGLFIWNDGTIYRAGDIERVTYVRVSGDGSTVATNQPGEGTFSGKIAFADADGSNLSTIDINNLPLGIHLTQDGSAVGWRTSDQDFLAGALFLAPRDGSSITVLAGPDEDADASYGVGQLTLR
jgi:hypothetical protein